MKWICISNNVPEAAVVSSSLAEILRAGIAGHEFVPLNEELKLLERYVGIQQIRFPDKFSFKAEPDADTLDASVPALMLQPLVENAILHGFEQIDGGRVSVKSFIQDGVLYIDVLDDGEGIPPELVERLEDVEYRDEGHLGIHNVASILRMFYGEPYGLRVMPAEKGAWIRLSMPFILNGQEGTP
jgi:two-component system sensor histidine kinase YesM